MCYKPCLRAAPCVRPGLVATVTNGGLAIRLGGVGSCWLLIRSRREALRTRASLTAIGRFAEGIGIKRFGVEL